MAAELGRQLSFRRHLALCALAFMLHQVAIKLNSQIIPSNSVVISASALQLSSHSFDVVSGKGEVGFHDRNMIEIEVATNKSNEHESHHKLQITSRAHKTKRFSNIEDSTLKSPMNDDDDDFNIIKYTLDLIGYYLPVINLNFTLVHHDSFVYHQLDVDVEDYYEERYRKNMTLDELQFEAIKAAMRLAPMPLHTSWGYESREQLKLSSWPVHDDNRCAAHLNQLTNRLTKLTLGSPSLTTTTTATSPGGSILTNNNNQQDDSMSLNSLTVRSLRNDASPIENYEAQLLYKSNDIYLLRYLDTFGRVPSDLLRGNVKWYGSYSGCLDTKLKADPSFGGGTKRIKFRYCMAALKSVGWRNNLMGKKSDDNKMKKMDWNEFGVHTSDFATGNNFFIRLGVCLPESCDSSAFDYQENVQNIEKLVKFNLMKPFNSDHYYLSDLYCIPDQRSPIVSIPLAGKLLILFAILWLLLILIATTVHLNVERFYRKAVSEIRQKRAANVLHEPDKLERQLQRRRLNSGEHYDDEIEGEGTFEEHDNNEFKESDILKLKHNWIKLNLYIFDHLKNFIQGVDLVSCLSLYSNWLKYTKRLKLAIAQLNAQEERRERCRIRNEKLVDVSHSRKGRISIRITDENAKVTSPSDSIGKLVKVLDSTNKSTSSERQQIKSSITDNVSSSGSYSMNLTNKQQQQQQQQNTIINEQVEKEINKRQLAKDELDEFESEFVKRRVDTSSLNALKVIALFWIIAGHCIFYLGSNISNGAILKNYVRDIAAFALANGAMYITELFFVITGCLTAYLAFKYNTFKLSDKDDEKEETNSSSSSCGSNLLVSNNNNNEDNCSQKTTISSDNPQTSVNNALTGGSSRRKSRAEIEASEHFYLESRMFKISFWISIAINRYLRIVPTYLLVYSLVKLVSVYIGGSGQVWDYAVSANSMRRKCVQESWLPILTLTTNFVSIYEHCIAGGWYLSVDMQFMLLAIPCLLILAYCQRDKQAHQEQKQQNNHFAAFNNNKQSGQQQLTFSTTTNIKTNNKSARIRKGLIETKVSKSVLYSYLIIFSVGLFSAIISIIHGLYQSEVDLSIILKFVPHTVAMLTKNISMYTNSLFRLRAFAFGLILGHLLYLYEFKLIKLPIFIQQHGAKVTSTVFAVGFCIMFSPILYPKGKVLISHDMTAILMVLTASGVDLFLCTLIFLMCIGKAPKIVLFVLNSPFWSVLSSLSLCAFLIHTEVIITLSSQLNPPPTAKYSLLLLVFSATLIVTYLLALGLYLCFEMPVGRLIEAFMRKYLGNSKIVKSDNPTGNTI